MRLEVGETRCRASSSAPVLTTRFIPRQNSPFHWSFVHRLRHEDSLASRAREIFSEAVGAPTAGRPIFVPTPNNWSSAKPDKGSTDFWGISFAFSRIDRRDLSIEEQDRELTLMQACWVFFDAVRSHVSTGDLPENGRRMVAGRQGRNVASR